MARINKRAVTKLEIVQTASRLFLEKGYSNTSVRAISDELEMSPGNLTFYYPTKEHLLVKLVELLCDFQWKLLEYEADKGFDSIGSVCLELMTVAAACQENPVSRDFFLAVFQSELCREYLLCNHVDRAKRIFSQQCSGWTEQQFVQAELLVMGIQYITIASADRILPLKTRISGALKQILDIYGVEEQTGAAEIEAVLKMDCRDVGKRVLAEFCKYVEQTNEQALLDRLKR